MAVYVKLQPASKQKLFLSFHLCDVSYHMRLTVHGYIGFPAVLILTQDPVLRQGAVADRVGCLVGPQVVHWNTETPVHFLVVQDVMSVTGVKTHKQKQLIYYAYLLCIDK